MKAGPKTRPVALVILVGCLVCTGAVAEDERPRPVVSAEVEPDNIVLGRPATLTVRVKTDGGSFRLPDSIDLDPFVELSRSRDVERAEGRELQVFRIELTTYEKTGEVEIPGFELVADSADGGTRQEEVVEVPAVDITVESVLKGVDKPEPRDVAAPVSIAVKDYRLLIFAGLVLAWLLVAFALRFKRAPVRVAPRYEDMAPSRPAHEIALEKLKRIVEDDLLRKGRHHEFFVRISDAVREYLGNRYGFFALDLTTRELLNELRDRPTRGLDFSMLERLLAEADLVKFARFPPSDEMASRAIDGAFSLVEATRRHESEEAA